MNVSQVLRIEAAQSPDAIHAFIVLNCVVASCEHVEARIETEAKQKKETGMAQRGRRRESRRGRNLFSTFN